MVTGEMSEVIQHLQRAVFSQEWAGLTDGQLLKDYLGRPDGAALAALVRRHGPMVWGVCRRVLRNDHDAEDAFQAAFLVLVRKAASIASPELLANWLYGVAHQTALKARATTAKRKVRERQVTEMPEPAVTERDLWNDLLPLLDQELSRLPDKYRSAIVLCELEGKTRKEAARQLGVPEGTLAARVARGRVMLAKRLARHGPAVSGGALAAVLTQDAASAGVPISVVSATIKAAGFAGAGQAVPTGAISAQVAALTEGAIKAMFLHKLSKVMAMLAVVAVGLFGAALLGSGTASGLQSEPRQGHPVALHQDRGEAARQGAVKVDAKKWTLDFQFKDPRVVVLDLPQKGRTSVAYLWCKVINNTGGPIGFTPGFAIVDAQGTAVVPKAAPVPVVEAIRNAEDPAGSLSLIDLMTIRRQALRPAALDTRQGTVVGVVTWDAAYSRGKTLTVFVSGLSNEQRWDANKQPLLKTLKLSFTCEGAEFRFASREWVYRPAAETRTGQLEDDQGDERRRTVDGEAHAEDAKQGNGAQDLLQAQRLRAEVEKQRLIQQVVQEVRLGIAKRLKDLEKQLADDPATLLDSAHAEEASLAALWEIEKAVREMQRARQKVGKKAPED
jgi:RNA polymerase sigma factor (sigma-70 family)